MDRMEIRNLEGKVAVVTGAGSGIGRETALALGGRGARLSICDIDNGGLSTTAEQIERLGCHVYSQQVDVASLEQMEQFAERTYGAFGRTDILVNNAGIGIGGSFVDLPIEAWDKIVGINIMGVVHGCHSFVPRMIASGEGGHIVNIASMAGYIQSPLASPYGTTKYAVIGFSECLRSELAEKNIGVSAICPGVINTPILRSTTMHGPENRKRLQEEGIRIFERRNYSPERVAKGILVAIQKNLRLAPITVEARIGYWVKRLLPGLVAWFAQRQAAGIERRIDKLG